MENKRDISVFGENRRSKYDEVNGIVESITSLNTSRGLLEEYKTQLLQLDPFLSHLYYLQNIENIDSYEVVNYRITWPSIKDLNDNVIGISNTGTFLQNFHSIVSKHFSALNAIGLYTFYKGGFFMINQVQKKLGSSSERTIPNSELTAIANELQEALLTLLKQIRDGLLNDLDLNQYSDVDREELEGQVANLEMYIEVFKAANPQVSYGISKLSPEIDDRYLDILNSERAALISSYRVREDDEKRSRLQRFYLDKYLLDFYRERQRIYSMVINEEGAYPEVNENWREYFYIDENGYLRMKVSMIKQIRKGRVAETNEDRVFFGYYQIINAVDAIKNFKAANFAVYQSRIDSLLSLLKRIDTALEHDSVNLSDLFLDIQKELELSIKNEKPENQISGTARSLVHSAIEWQGTRVAYIALDHVGFGNVNLASYELKLLKMVQQVARHSNQLVEQTLKELGNGDLPDLRESLNRDLFTIGDYGTGILRDSEAKVQDLFHKSKMKISIDSSGGDELNALVSFEKDEDLVEVMEEVNDVVQNTKFRIAVIIFNESFDFLSPDAVRKTIVKLINAFFLSDQLHLGIKKNEEANIYKQSDIPIVYRNL